MEITKPLVSCKIDRLVSDVNDWLAIEKWKQPLQGYILDAHYIELSIWYKLLN